MPRSAPPPAPLTPLAHLFLYDEPDALGLDLADLGAYLQRVFPSARLHRRCDFLTHHLARFPAPERAALGEELVAQLQRARVEDLVPPGRRQWESPQPPGPDEEFFHGPSLQALLHLLLPPGETHLGDLHLAFTGLRLGQWVHPDEPLQQLMALFGEPNLLSISGLLEAPGRAREYRFLQVQLAMFGLEESLEDLEDRFAPQVLEEGDPRLGQVLRGLLLQAAAYRLWGEVFCAEETCRLHAAPTHEELLATHASPASGLCPRHRAWLQAAGGDPGAA